MANPAMCPKCGRKVDATAFICPGCEYILDTSFLGDDITDDDRDRRALARGAAEKRGVSFGEDAIILGDSDGEWSDFSSRDAGGMTREVTQARFYIGGSTAVLLQEDAVPEMVPGVVPASLKMTPFEQHLLQFMNGKRSMGRIKKKSGMDDAEFKASVAMLADKGVIRLRTTKKKKSRDGLSRSESSRGMAVAPDGDRTTVAPPPFDLSEVKRGAAAAPAAPPSRSGASRSEVTGLKNVESKKSRLPGPASVRLLDDEKIDDRGKVEAFGEGERHENASSVFARASVPPVSRSAIVAASAKEVLVSPATNAALEERTPSLPDEAVQAVSFSLLPPGGAEDLVEPLAEARDYGASDHLFDDEVSSPTALGSLRPAVPRRGSAEVDERDGDEEASVRVGTRPMIHEERTANLPPLSDAPTGPAPKGVADDDDEGDEDSAEAGADAAAVAPQGEDAEGFEVELRTAALGGAESVGPSTGPSPPPIQELPSDALQPLPSPVLAAPPPPSVIAPAFAPAAPTTYQPPATYGAPEPAPPLALPGQVLAKPTAPTRPGLAASAAGRPAPGPVAPSRPPTVGGGGLAPRPSQQSTVPFEQARKAEKIFDQAVKDHAEGRLSSARMNVKLAVMYDPSVPTYQDFLAELDREGAGAKSPNASKPRELLLFEQASALEGKGDYEGAVKLLQQAIETAPRAAALRNRIGVVLSVRLKRHEEAMAQLKVAIELEPGSMVFMNNYSKVTAMLDSELEKGPEKSKGKKDDRNDKIAIKKMRPKMF